MEVQQLFTNLKKEAECPLCLETVNNPKTLPCIHSFCLKCLDKHANFARRQLQTAIKCPVCQTSFAIPEGDSFKNLPASFHLNRLVDVLALKDGTTQAQKCGSCDENNAASSYCFVCLLFLCTSCFEAHQRVKTSRGHRNVVLEKLQAQDVEELIHRPVMCSQQYHENQPLEFYCEECKVPICIKCSVVSHNRHTITDTQKAAQVQKIQMKDALEKAKAETVIYDNKLRKQTELMEKSRKEVISAEEKMTDAVDECIRQLQEHKKTMKANFAEIHQGQQKHHATRLENFEFALAQLKSCVEQGESIVKRNISAEILQTNQAIIGRYEELLSAKKPEIYKPSHVHYMVEEKVKILDRVVVSDTDPLMSLVEIENQKEKREKVETNFTIVTRNSDGKQFYHEEDQVKVNISAPADDQLETEIKDTKDGKYTVTYTPQCVGQHRVDIQVNGQPLTGSPWVVQVIPHRYQFAFQFGSKGEEQGQFNEPVHIIVNDKTERIAVFDRNNRRSQVFDFEGKFLNEKPWIALNACDGKFFFINIKEEDNLFLCNEDGKHIRSFEAGEEGCAVFECDGHMIACFNTDAKTIKVLTPDGKHEVQSFSAPNCDRKQDFVLYDQGKFFVPEAHRVRVFNSAGVHLFDIGKKGSGDGQLMHPTGLTIDKFNHLIVCDSLNKRLQVFTLDGKFIAKIEESFFNDSRLAGCAVSNTGYLFVADGDGNCVYVFN